MELYRKKRLVACIISVLVAVSVGANVSEVPDDSSGDPDDAGKQATLILDRIVKEFGLASAVADTMSATVSSMYVAHVGANNSDKVWISPLFLKNAVNNIVGSSDAVYGSAVAFDVGIYSDVTKEELMMGVAGYNASRVMSKYGIYAPYAFEGRKEPISFDLGTQGYNYTTVNGTGQSWFVDVKDKIRTEIKMHATRNKTRDSPRKYYRYPGLWTDPYFDEGGGNITMVTYSSPVVASVAEKDFFLGVVTIDIPVDTIVCKETPKGRVCSDFSCGPESIVDIVAVLGGLYTCRLCGAGFYKVVGDGTHTAGFTKIGEASCGFCPSGGYCQGRGDVRALKGFWMETANTTIPQRCLRYGHCCTAADDGGEEISCGADSPYKCLKGRKGFMCAECVDGLGPFDGSCLPCKPDQRYGASFYAFLILPALLALCFFLYPTSVPKLSGLPRSEIFDICSDYLQLLTVTLSPVSFFTKYSSLNAIKSILVLASGGQGDNADGESWYNCPLFLSPTASMYVWSIFSLMCIAWYTAMLPILLYFYGKKKQAQRKKVLNEWLSGAWKLYFTLYTPIIEAGFISLNCNQMGEEGQRRNVEHPEVLCSTRKYKIAQGLALPVTLIYGLLVPMYMVYMIGKLVRYAPELFSSMKSKLLHLEVDIGMSRSDAAVHKLVTRDSDSNITSMRRRINGVFSKTKNGIAYKTPKRSTRILRKHLGTYTLSEAENMRSQDIERQMRELIDPRALDIVGKHSILFMRYKIKFRAIGCPVFLLRRFLYIAVHYSLITDSDSYLASSVLFVLAVAFMLYQGMARPFVRFSDNILSVFSMFLLVLNAGIRLKLLRVNYEFFSTPKSNTKQVINIKDRLSYFNNIVLLLFLIWLLAVSSLLIHHLLINVSRSYRRKVDWARKSLG